MRRDILALTYCTKDQPNLRYWINSALLFDYEFKIIGFREPWKSWKGRAKMYFDHLGTLADDRVVICCDSNDLFFVGGAHELRQKFENWEKGWNGFPVIVGAESACCTGEYNTDKSLKSHALLKTREYTSNRYRFPNGGFVMGRAKPMHTFYSKLLECDDDQACILRMYIDNPTAFYLDSSNIFCGNIAAVHGLQIEFAENWDDALVNKGSLNKPSVVHFPGIGATQDWSLYHDLYSQAVDQNHVPTRQYNSWIFIVVMTVIVLLCLFFLSL